MSALTLPPLPAFVERLRVPQTRYLAAAGTLLVILLLSLSSTSSSSISAFRSRLGASADGYPSSWLGGGSKVEEGGGKVEWEEDVPVGLNTTRVNAAFVILARNSDVWEIVRSIRGMEDRFNKKYHYPYVFLNDEPFDEQFKKHTQGIASGECSYGLVPASQWSEHPAHIDEDKAAEARQRLAAANVIYGGSVSYRHMCRYQSGFFFRHELLANYKYYWRIEPNVQYFCDIDYDPFKVMEQGGKKYGFTVSLYEYQETIPTLWDETKAFIDANPQYLARPNQMAFLSNDKGKTYNRCHFWSNFEIGDLDFWRGEAYMAYFEHLDKAGGFYYERWGDAPVHSIAAALFLRPDEMQFFHDIGYRHEPFQHCPKDLAQRCACNPNDENNFEEHWYSCTPTWKKITHWKPEKLVG